MLSGLITSENSKINPSLNALTRLQAKVDPILATKTDKDVKSTTSNKRQNRKKKTKKSKKRIVGTTVDPVTIQNASDDSDNSLSSKSHHEDPKEPINSAAVDIPKRTKPNKPGVYPAPDQEIHKLKQAIELVQETQAVMEPIPKPIPNAWKLPTTLIKPPHTGKPLQVPSVISERSEEEHEADFERWYQDMLTQTNPEMEQIEELSEHAPEPQLENAHPNMDVDPNDTNDIHENWDLPQTPSEGRSVVGTQLNAQKLMNFLGMPITTTMLVKLKGDPELAETLRSFLNDELIITLDSLQETPLDHVLPQEAILEQSPEPVLKKEVPETDAKSLFRLRVNMLGDYFEGDDSNAVLPIDCKGNSILAVLDGGAGVSIITKRCWERMACPSMEVANLTVKLANGSLVKALGLLRNFKIKVLDHHVYHTFAVMDFNDKPGSYEMILGRPFMRDYHMVHDWYHNQVYLTITDEHVRVDLQSGKSHPMAHGFFRENSDTTVFSDSEATTSLNYCKTCKKETDPDNKDYTQDYTAPFDDNWNQLLATVDVWGKRGITCVTADGIPIPEVVPLNTLSVEHFNDTDESSDSDPNMNSRPTNFEGDSINTTSKGRRSFKTWRQNKKNNAHHNKKLTNCATTAQWLQFVDAFDANRKMLDNWGEQLQHMMHHKPPHIELKKLEAHKDTKSSKSLRRKRNREAAQAEKQAKKELKETETENPHKDLHSAPDRFKAFTIGERHLIFDKAQRKPSEGNTTGYDGPAEVKEIDLADEGEDPKPAFIATDLSHLEE